MMIRLHVWLIFVLLQFADSLQTIGSETMPPDATIHVYTYASTLTSPNHTSIDREIKGNVLVKVRILSPKRKPSGAAPGAKRFLIHLLVKLAGHDEPLQAMVLREESGLVQNVFLPSASETNSSDFRLNFVKAIASLFNYHLSFQPGVEYDSSGRCQTYYAEVENSPLDKFDGDELIVVDKQKMICSPISEPLDAGVWSVSPILKQRRISHSYMRFFIQRKTRLLTRVKTSEHHRLSFALDESDSEADSFVVIGEQKLDILPEGEEKNEIIRKLGDQMKIFPKGNINTLVTAVIGERYQTHHLALAIPSSRASYACGIQSMSFTPETLDSAYVSLTLETLKRNVESFQTVLESHARITSVHASLQLLRFLRCLPFTPEAIRVSASALNFILTSKHEIFHSQLRATWQDQLIDVVVNCGTKLCQELLRQRLVGVTELASFERSGSAVSSDIKAVRTHLLNTLWPALAHISNPFLITLQEFTSICLTSLPVMIKAADDFETENPYNCLLTVAALTSLLPSLRNENNVLISKVITALSTSMESLNEAFIDDHNKRQALLATFAASELLKTPLLAPVLFDIVDNSKIPAILRFVALKTLSNLQFDKNRSHLAQISSRILNLIDSPMLPGQDELIIKYGAFNVLLNIETPAPDVACVLARLADAKKWSLLASCRTLVSSWCQQELISEAACRCIQMGGPLRTNQGHLEQPIRWCRPGLSAGWSGLAGDNSTGSVNLISGELVDQRPTFLSDYSIQWIQGPYGEFRASNLGINVIGADSEAKVMGFNIYGDNLANLMGKHESGPTPPWLAVGFSFLRGVIPPKQIFSGGITDIMGILFAAPDQPTPFFKSLRLPIDVRHYLPLSSGWLIRSDILGATSIELSAAIQSSMWTQSGKSLLRTRIAVAMEHHLTAITPQPITASTFSTAVHGMGSAARLDFLTRVEMASLPDSICMSFQRNRATPVIRWAGDLREKTVLGERGEDLLKPLPIPIEVGSHNRDFVLTQTVRLAPISYFLGVENSQRCSKMKGTIEW